MRMRVAWLRAPFANRALIGILMLFVFGPYALLVLRQSSDSKSFLPSPEFCNTILGNNASLKVIHYLNKDHDIDASVKRAFISEIKRCVENKQTSLIFKTEQERLNFNSFADILSQHISAPLNSLDYVKKLNYLLKNGNPDAEAIARFLNQPIINRHDFPYKHSQADACRGDDVKFIIAVPSSPDNFENRQKVRGNSAGKFVKDSRNRAKMLFFLGTFSGKSEKEREIQNKIDEEAKQFGDIVQSSFIDVYRNLTKKASLILKWSSTFCEPSKYVIRMDDDLRVDLRKMTAAIESTGSEKVILGNVASDWGPVRKKGNRYYTSLEEYPYDKLPDFVLGGSMAYSVETAGLLFKAYQRLKLFWLDDVFISAMCASNVGVKIRNSSDFLFQHWKW